MQLLNLGLETSYDEEGNLVVWAGSESQYTLPIEEDAAWNLAVDCIAYSEEKEDALFHLQNKLYKLFRSTQTVATDLEQIDLEVSKFKIAFDPTQHPDFELVCENALNSVSREDLTDEEWETHKAWVVENWEDLNAS